MTTNFVTFYLIIVLITGPFFQFIPLSETLLWDEILLAKILNQAPTIFLLFYLLSQTKKIKQSNVFVLLIAFLFCGIFSEVYYYFIDPEICFIVVIIHNIFTYCILIFLLFFKKISFKNLEKNILLSSTLLTGLVILAFSFSVFAIYKEYFSSKLSTFFILILFIISAISLVFLSFFIENPFQRSWYEIVIGIFSIVVVDIYTYSCIFVFNSAPNLLYTIGKIIFSVGLLLLVDGILRQKSQEKNPRYIA